MRTLIVTAVDIEKNAVLRGLLDTTTCCDIITGGVGPIEAAIHTTMKLASTPYDLVINMGIAGGFLPHVKIGSLVIATETICANLGAETQNGFLSLDELGFGTIRIEANSSLVMYIKDALTKRGIPTIAGPILTVSTTTGTTETATKLTKQVPGTIAEAMEGFGVASAASTYDIPFIEIRAISNFVGPRDTTSWCIDQALATLTVTTTLLEQEVALFENRIFTLS